MSNPGTFRVESRPYGDDGKLVPMVGCTCKRCDTTTWVRSATPGAGYALFGRKGWRLGRHGTSADICPVCIAAQKAAKPATVYVAPPKEETAVPITLQPMNPVMEAKLTEALSKMDEPIQSEVPAYVAPPMPAPMPAELRITKVMPSREIKDPVHMTFDEFANLDEPWPDIIKRTHGVAGRGYSTRDAHDRATARRSAKLCLAHFGVIEPIQGVHYSIVRQSDGRWSWIIPGRKRLVPIKPYNKRPKRTSIQKTVRTEKAGYASPASAYQTALRQARLNGIENPVRGVHYDTFVQSDGRWAWKLLPQKESIEPMTLPELVESAAPTLMVDTISPSDLRQPSRDQRRSIMDALDTVYDDAKMRYRGAGSDAKTAKDLDVPRIWVSQIREQFHGDHDRNEQADQQLKDVTSALALAAQSVETLMSMAAEAEKIKVNLQATLDKLTK